MSDERPRYTSEQIEETIAHAIKEREFKVVPGLISLLAAQDPERAQLVLDSINLGMDVARARHERDAEAPCGSCAGFGYVVTAAGNRLPCPERCAAFDSLTAAVSS